MAARTRLAISFDPCQVLRTVCFFLIPGKNLLTTGGIMILVATCETKSSPTFTFARFVNCIIRSLNQIIAFLLWAPSYISIVVCKLLTVPKHVLLLVIKALFIWFISQIFQEE